MLGQDDMDPSQLTTEEIAQDPRAYSAKNVPQRMGIISAGVIMNVITGMLFFGIAFRLGVDSSPSVVGHAVVGKPAWEKGIRSGDVFTRINGRETKSFQDILRGTTLSRGDIQIEGHHADGETFKVVIQPDASGLRRMIGVSDARSLKVAEIGSDVKTTVVPGSPAEAVKDAFREDSLIVSFDGTPIETYAQLQTLLARHRSEVIDLGIKQGDEVRSVLLKPARFREVGLWMDIEQIAAIQDGSPAAKGGLKVGDKITSVNGVDVGKAINPLHLAEHLEMLAGQEVEIRVKRTVEGSPKLEEVTVKLTPDDTPAWIEYPFSDGTPLGIPSIGVAYHLTSNVLKVLPDSPAAKAGVPEGGVLESVKIESDDETYNKIFADKSIELKFVDPTKKSMAFALWQFQEVPDAKVTLKFKGDAKQYEIKPVPSKEEWYIAQRGIFLQPQSQLLIADTWGDAFRMGVYQTQNTGLDIYMTLRNLISRDLSPQNLSGPVGIAKAAYAVSKQGIPQLLMFLGLLSINLAILNFLPIPVLDGGHMVFLIWEGVTRRKPSEKVLIAASYVGMAFVLGLMLFVLYLDFFVHGSRG